MTTTSPTIPAWINADAIVNAELKAEAEALTAEFLGKYQELWELCYAADDLLKRLADSEPSREATDSFMMGTDLEVVLEVSDAVWKIFHEINGAGPLYRAVHLLEDLFKAVEGSGNGGNLRSLPSPGHERDDVTGPEEVSK